jgi:predicted dehydrogenase
MDREVLWGLAGCGDIAEKRVVKAIQDSARARLVGCVRRNAQRLAEFQSRHAIPKGYANYRALVSDPELDAVYVATPVWLHCSQTLEAAERGKHVLCEKPMAMNPQECGRMIDACRSNGVKLGVAYYRRFYPVVLKMKEILRQGLIGEPILVRSTLVEHARLADGENPGWRFVLNQGGGGLLMDMASHRLDLLVMLFGRPESVAGFTDTRTCPIEVEDTGSLLIRFSGGIHALVFASHCVEPPRDDFEILGSRGCLRAAPLNGDRLEMVGVRTETLLVPKADNVHQPLVEDFNGAVLEDRQPTIPGEEGIQASLLLQAAYRSARSGSVVPVDRPTDWLRSSGLGSV